MSPGLNCESLDRVKLSRLKYLFLQTNKYLSQFLKWSVSMFSVMDALICEYTDVIWISCIELLQNSCLSGQARRPDEHAGSVAELVGSFGRQSEQWTLYMARCVTPKGWCSIRYTISTCLLKFLTFCYFLSFPEAQDREMFLATIAEIMLENYSPWLLASTMKKKCNRKLTVACHRHHTELV